MAHAVADALLGAAAMGDLGRVFPDTDERWKDANSMQLLAEVKRQVRAPIAAGERIHSSSSTTRSSTPSIALPQDLRRSPAASVWSSGGR